MLKKLIFFAITSGLAAKAYRAYANKPSGENYTSGKRSDMPTTGSGSAPRAN